MNDETCSHSLRWSGTTVRVYTSVLSCRSVFFHWVCLNTLPEMWLLCKAQNPVDTFLRSFIPCRPRSRQLVTDLLRWRYREKTGVLDFWETLLRRSWLVVAELLSCQLVTDLLRGSYGETGVLDIGVNAIVWRWWFPTAGNFWFLFCYEFNSSFNALHCDLSCIFMCFRSHSDQISL